MKNSKISWTDHTQNFWIGCTKVSPGCENCYAEARDIRFGGHHWGKGQQRQKTKTWLEPAKWNLALAGTGRRERVFVNSLSDFFDVEVEDQWRIDAFNIMINLKNLDWLLLTKRPEHAVQFFKTYPRFANLSNVWMGTTTENQKTADERIPILLSIPAVIHWLSVEPQIDKVCLQISGGVDFDEVTPEECEDNTRSLTFFGNVDWVVCGGESQTGARLFNLAWARLLRDECKEARIPFFMKQLGEWWKDGSSITKTMGDKWDKPEMWPTDLRVQEFPNVPNGTLQNNA